MNIYHSNEIDICFWYKLSTPVILSLLARVGLMTCLKTENML